LCTGVDVEGLYREDERYGPGLFSDIDSGQDDVGFWLREYLVKLCVSLPDVFVVRDHWPLLISADDDLLRVTASGQDAGVTSGRAPTVVDCMLPPADLLLDARLPADSLAVDRRAFEESFSDAVDDWPPTWRRQLRQICIGLCLESCFFHRCVIQCEAVAQLARGAVA